MGGSIRAVRDSPEPGDGDGLVACKRVADDREQDGHDAARGLAGHGRPVGDPKGGPS